MSGEGRSLAGAARQAARQLAQAGRRFDRRGWVLGTSGNFSARLPGPEPGLLLTASGRPKGRLGPADFLLLAPDGRPARPDLGKPSAETAIHLAIYGLLPQVRCVLHVHSPYATFCSDRDEPELVLRDFEMLKGLGHAGPFGALRVPVLPNAVEARDIAAKLERPLLEGCPGLLIRNHGLYAWGRSVDEAEQHVECFEFLFQQLWLRGAAGSGGGQPGPGA